MLMFVLFEENDDGHDNGDHHDDGDDDVDDDDFEHAQRAQRLCDHSCKKNKNIFGKKHASHECDGHVVLCLHTWVHCGEFWFAWYIGMFSKGVTNPFRICCFFNTREVNYCIHRGLNIVLWLSCANRTI